ncbi:MAG: DinB family protein [Terriglobales bacterium]
MRGMAGVIDDIQRSIEGESWQGPSIREILEGIGARDAAAHPIADAHSIWGLLLHVTAWIHACDSRVRGNITELAGESDWPPVHDTSESAWKAAFEDLRRAEAELTATLGKLRDDDLDGPVPNRPYDRAHLLHGLAQHNAYHAGQMSLLKRALKNSKGGAQA